MPRYTFPVGTPLRHLVKNPNCARRTFIALGSWDAGVECEAPRPGCESCPAASQRVLRGGVQVGGNA